MVDKVLSKGLQNIECILYKDVCSRNLVLQ